MRAIIGAVPVLAAFVITPAIAQIRLTIDPVLSLAWYQINPHLNHLWATTCPEEPSWRPGESHSGGWLGTGFRLSRQGNASVSDTVGVPIFPRYEARARCTEAVEGEILAADTVTWRGVRGRVIVKADKLVSGDPRRDAFTKSDILDVGRYPEIRFTIDSLVDLRREADTIVAKALGVFSTRGVGKPITAGVRAWPEAGGLRVTAKFHVPAEALTDEFGVSKFALGLGVRTNIWHHLFMGVDVILRATPPTGTNPG
jgi:hypothetical protein